MEDNLANGAWRRRPGGTPRSPRERSTRPAATARALSRSSLRLRRCRCTDARTLVDWFLGECDEWR